MNDRGQGVRLYLWMTYLYDYRYISNSHFPVSLIGVIECSGRAALLTNGSVTYFVCYFIIITAVDEDRD